MKEISERASELTVSELIDDLLSERAKIQSAVRSVGGIDALCQIMRKEFGLNENNTRTDLIRQVFPDSLAVKKQLNIDFHILE